MLYSKQARDIQGDAVANTRRKPVILVVDDDDILRSCLELILDRRNFHVEGASNGKEALRKIHRNKPDLIILDGVMPVMDGFDTARVLKENPATRAIPIIFCTGQSISECAEKDIVVDAYCGKPFDSSELYEIIRDLLNNKKPD